MYVLFCGCFECFAPAGKALISFAYEVFGGAKGGAVVGECIFFAGEVFSEQAGHFFGDPVEALGLNFKQVCRVAEFGA